MKKYFWLAVFFMIAQSVADNSVSAKESSELLSEDHHLYESFTDFAFSRISILNRNYIHTPDNIHIKVKDALCIASYQQVNSSSVAIEVKMTGSSLTPFIGVLKYIESVYESNGLCKENFAQGPFLPVRHRRVTEIFRYVQNKWQ